MNYKIMHAIRTPTMGLSLIILLVMTFSSQSAVALGMGNIRVTSSLNEPLSASITILKDSSERRITADDLTIGLADKALHENAGITFQNILRDLRFSIVTDSNGQLVLNIYTVRNIYEPLLNFLIDLRWREGRLVKEYSMILDPRSFNAQRATVPVTPSTQNSVTPQNTRTRSTRAASRPLVLDGNNYQVRNGDSLSKIAMAVRARDGGELAQIMADIYAANPEAFLGSPDQLKANVPLRIPTGLDIANEMLGAPVEIPDTIPASDITTVTTPPVVADSNANNNGPRLEILPPDENLPVATSIAGSTETDAAGISTAERDALALNMRELQQKLDKLAEQNAQLAAQNARFERELAAATMNPRLIEIERNQLSTDPIADNADTPGFWSKFFRYFPWLLIPLLGLALLVQFWNKQKLNRLTLGMAKPYQNPNPGNRRVVADLDEYDAVQAEPIIPQTKSDNLIETQQLVDDLTKSQEVYTPTAIVDADNEPTQTFVGSLDDIELDAGQNLDAAQEAEIYLAYQQFKLADKTITRLLEVDPENYKFQILKLQLLAKTGKMEELQELSVELLSRFPNRNDEIHQRIQDICDMAFSANLGAQVDSSVTPKAAGSVAATQAMPEYDDTKELDPDATVPTRLPDTPIQDDITEFLNEDLTLSDTDPMLVGSIIDHEADTEIMDGSDYNEMSDQLTELMDDITEEGLDLPFDLETEIMQEEEKQRLLEERERNHTGNPESAKPKRSEPDENEAPKDDDGDKNTLLKDDDT